MTRPIELLLVLAALGCVEAQRGCPSEGCDPRGLNCQADFAVNNKYRRYRQMVPDLGVCLQKQAIFCAYPSMR